MKIFPGSPPLPHVVRSSFQNRNRNSEIQAFSESSRTVNLTCDYAVEDQASIDHDELPRANAYSLRSSSYRDADYGEIISERRSPLSEGSANLDDGNDGDEEEEEDDDDEEEEEEGEEDDEEGEDHADDDNDDGLQWANSRRPLETAPQVSSGYGDRKGFYAGRIVAYNGKENKVKISRKLASRVQQHAGLIRPNSGPFSGPLKATAKANITSSIIPVNLKCKKMLGLDVCEPVSPEVTCLGRIKIKEAHSNAAHGTTANKPGPKAGAAAPPTPKVEKGRCFDTKNQLCGKRPKARKKKKVAEKSKCLKCRRRYASREATDRSMSFSSSASFEQGETRREKAASLARSLTDLLEDVRRHRKERIECVPSVPPPNSLLLMRGCRRRDDSRSFTGEDMAEKMAGRNVEVCRDANVRIEALDGEGSGDAIMRTLRSSGAVHFSLLDLIDMEDGNFSASDVEETIRTHRTGDVRARVRKTFFKEIEEDDKKKDSASEGSDDDTKREPITEGHSSSQVRPSRVALWQRRSFTELMPISTEHMKQKMDHHSNR